MLWPRCQAARNRGERAKIVYPAKLILNIQAVDNALHYTADETTAATDDQVLADARMTFYRLMLHASSETQR